MTCHSCQTEITNSPSDTDDFNAWAVLCDDGEHRCGSCADNRRKAERKARRQVRRVA